MPDTSGHTEGTQRPCAAGGEAGAVAASQGTSVLWLARPPGRTWQSGEAGGVTPAALTGAPSTPAPQPRRGGRAPGQLGRGGPPPAPQTPPGVSTGPLQKSLQVGEEVNSKFKRPS